MTNHPNRSRAKPARFWHWHNGAVLITLRPGETLHHSWGGPTDEGWNRETCVWSFDGSMLRCEYHQDGADCDGRMSHWSEAECPVNELRTGYTDEDGTSFPAWRKVEQGQRDYSAEAMGY